MGKFSILLVLSIVVTGGITMYNMHRTTAQTDERVGEHQYHVIARDASSTGMSVTLRKLANHLNENWSAFAFDQARTTYDGGYYEVTAIPDTCSILTDARLNTLTGRYSGVITSRDLIEVRSTGLYRHEAAADDSLQSHQMIACYLQADWNDPSPPAFEYAFISEETFDFNGGPEIQAYLDGEGNIHSNLDMHLGPQVVVDGHATLVDTTNSSVHKNTTISSFGYGPSIPLRPFEPLDYDPYYPVDPLNPPPTEREWTIDYVYDPTDVVVDGTATIRDLNLNPDDHGASDPYLWYVNGDLTIKGELTLPGYTIIVVNGSLNIQGDALVSVSGTTPPGDEDGLRAWIGEQLLDGETSPIAWYVDRNVILDGTPNVVGNFYTNGDFTLNGGGQGDGNLVGNVVALGEITANGGGDGMNFWFIEVGEEVVIPGVLLPGKQIVRLALAEWTDPVLDNPPLTP